MRSLLLLPLILLSSCATPAPQPKPQALPTISYTELGQRVWQNECAGTKEGLVSWNKGENFPSLGIGHFIWFPAGINSPFEESFPHLIAYAQQRGIAVPSYFLGAAPWPNQAAFYADKSGRVEAMRNWLAQHIELQSQFLVLRSRASLQKIVQNSQNPQIVAQRIAALLATTQGNYCLIDYVNFKGEGLKPTERYQGQGWGLLQVLEEMHGSPQGQAATAEFARAAAAVLTRRVRNAPAQRNEQVWLAGWLNRCKSYR